MCGKQLAIPSTAYPRKPSCSVVSPHSTDDAGPPRTKSDETVQILNYASFEIATALVHPAHFRQVTTAPAYNGIFCDPPYLTASNSPGMEELLIQAPRTAAVLPNSKAKGRYTSLKRKLRICVPYDQSTPSPDRLSQCPRPIQPSILCWIHRSVCQQCHEIVAGGRMLLASAMSSCLSTLSSCICASMSEDPHIAEFTAPGMDVASS